MPIINKEIENISHLARIELADIEKKKLAQDLGDILDYFEVLKKLDTSGIEPANQPIELENITRFDELKSCRESSQKAILKNAPDKSGRYFKVNKIL